MILGNTAWINDELIEIRALEQRFCRRLNSSTPQSGESLLRRLRDLNSRVDLLARVLDR
jgi:hypothetical protein